MFDFRPVNFLKTKVAFVALSLALLGLAGCGSDSSGTTTPSTNNNLPTPVIQPTPVGSTSGNPYLKVDGYWKTRRAADGTTRYEGAFVVETAPMTNAPTTNPGLTNGGINIPGINIPGVTNPGNNAPYVPYPYNSVPNSPYSPYSGYPYTNPYGGWPSSYGSGQHLASVTYIPAPTSSPNSATTNQCAQPLGSSQFVPLSMAGGNQMQPQDFNQFYNAFKGHYPDTLLGQVQANENSLIYAVLTQYQIPPGNYILCFNLTNPDGSMMNPPLQEFMSIPTLLTLEQKL